MNVEVSCTDGQGGDAYRDLFNVIMSDIGKAVMIEKVSLILKPEVPLFIFSVRLRNVPESTKIKDAASVRTEEGDVHISISDERYAPEILSELWKRYGRARVDQSTRFDLTVSGADPDEIAETEISSEEDVLKDVIGAVWRAMPEGIRARHSLTGGSVITIMATEEIITKEMKNETYEVHKSMQED